MIRLLIFGGRNFDDPSHMAHCLHDFMRKIGRPDVIIEGGASGADQWAGTFADLMGIPKLVFPAEWDNIDIPGASVKRTRAGKPYNALAGIWRNQKMYAEGKPTDGMGFKGGPGTAHMAKLLTTHRIPIYNAGWH